MVQTELGTGLIRLAARVRDTARREREAGPAEKAVRVRTAANTRDEAVQFLAQACAALREWPSSARVGDAAADAAMAIFKVAQAKHMRVLLRLLEDSARRNQLSSVWVAEATDALCVAEQRPQIYGTVPGHPVADAARLDKLRGQVGLPLLGPTVKHARVPAPAPAPSLKQFPNGFHVLQGLLTDLPAVPALPRVVRPTVGSSEPWGCAYCCGKADLGSTELDIRGRVWRICTLCEAADDTPQGRLLDVLVSVGNIRESAAQTTVEAARDQGWRVPLRYEDAKARPNHRPQPRWANVPVAAIAMLIAYTEQHRGTSRRTVSPTEPQEWKAVVTPPLLQSAQPTFPSQVTGPTAPVPLRSTSTVWDGCTWRSPLLKSRRAVEMLSWEPNTPLTQLQVAQALQVGEGNIDQNGLRIGNVADLHAVLSDPPQWLRHFHAQRERERAANHARQTGQATTSVAVPLTPSPGPKLGPSPSTDVPQPRGVHGVPLPPHPDILVSPKAAQALTEPASTPLKPGRAAKVLQTAFTTMQKNNLTVPTVGDLAAVMHAPPLWLLAFHRKLAAERRANPVHP